MLNQPIRSLRDTGNVVIASPRNTVAEVVAMMLANRVSAVVVIEDGAVAGIFTEHDIVARVVAGRRDPHTVEVGEVMTREPLTVGPDATLGHALVLMHERSIRHLPVVENGRAIGLVCARDALDPELEDFICEERRRQAFR